MRRSAGSYGPVKAPMVGGETDAASRPGRAPGSAIIHEMQRAGQPNARGLWGVARAQRAPLRYPHTRSPRNAAPEPFWSQHGPFQVSTGGDRDDRCRTGLLMRSTSPQPWMRSAGSVPGVVTARAGRICGQEWVKAGARRSALRRVSYNYISYLLLS